MKKILLTALAALTGLSSVQADNYAIYSRTTSGNRVNSFSATILRIPAEYASKKFTTTFYVVRNTTTRKQTFIEAFVSAGHKGYSIRQTQIGKVSTTIFDPIPATSQTIDALSGLDNSKLQFILARPTVASAAAYIADASRPFFERDRLALLQLDSGTAGSLGTVDITANDQYALQGLISRVMLPKIGTVLDLPVTLTGSGLNCQVHALRDESANFRDYQSSEIICYDFAEKWTLNLSLSAIANGTQGFKNGTDTLNPNTDPHAAYAVTNMLEKGGYSLMTPGSR